MPADETDITGLPSFLNLSTIRPAAIGLRQISPVQTSNTLSTPLMDINASCATVLQKSIWPLSSSMATRALSLWARKALKKFGLVVGAVAPVGSMIEGLPVFVDHSVFEEEVVDISSGDPTAGLELKRDDLKKLLRDATIADLAKGS